MQKKYFAGALVLIIAAFCTSLYINRDNPQSDRKIHGMVDIRQSNISFERAGRIIELLKEEGDPVKASEVLARLDTRELELLISAQHAQCKALQKGLEKLEKGYRLEEIEAAQAQVHTLENSVALSELTYNRYEDLYKKRSTSAQERDRAFYTLKSGQGELDKARADLRLMKNGYRTEDVEEQRASYEGCMAELAHLEYERDEQSVLKAPFDGVVRARNQELGDLASTSKTVYEISLVRHKKVLAYATELQLSQIKVGMNCEVITAQGNKLVAKVASISSTAMFTPKTVQTEELRADLVYQVRIELDDPDEMLRLGQAVSVSY